MMGFAKRLVRLLAATWPLGLLILLVNPALILLAAPNFQVQPATWGLLLGLSFCICALLAFVFALLPGRLTPYLVAFFRAAFLVLFAISIFYPEGGRQLDGVEAQDPSSNFLISLYAAYAIATLVLTLLLLRYTDLLDTIYKFALACCPLIVGYYLFNAPTAPQQADTVQQNPKYASTANIVFILADMLQGTTVEQALKLNPEISGQLDGFYAFTRATSPFPFTNYGLPAILSGNLYSADKSVGYLENLDVARSNSFISDAKAKSYEVSIAGFDQLPIASNQFSYPTQENASFQTTLLAGLGLTRLTKVSFQLDDVSPGLKMLIGLKRESLIYFDLLTSAPIGKTDRKLTIQHNFIPHSPNYYSLANLTAPKLDWRPAEESVEAYMSETGYFLNKLIELTNHLKNIGIYDNSLILIVGDHGHFVGGQAHLYKAYPGAEDFVGYESGDWARTASMYNPAILVKPPQSKSSLRIRHDSMTTLDIREIMQLYLVEANASSYEQALSFADERASQVVVFSPEAAEVYTKTKNHQILEFSGNASAFARKYSELSKPRAEYPIGSTLEPANSLMDSNWSKEPKGSWLLGHTGRMVFVPTGLAPGPLRLTLRATPLRNRTHKLQRVEVRANDQFIGVMNFEETEQTLSIDIPAAANPPNAETFKLEFTPLDAKSPQELGLWNTGSPVSIFVYSMQLSPQ